MSGSTKSNTGTSRLPVGFGELAAGLLDELIAEFGATDVLALRQAQLAAVPQADVAHWRRVEAALDHVIGELRLREGAILRGEVEPPPEANTHAQSASIEPAQSLSEAAPAQPAQTPGSEPERSTPEHAAAQESLEIHQLPTEELPVRTLPTHLLPTEELPVQALPTEELSLDELLESTTDVAPIVAPPTTPTVDTERRTARERAVDASSAQAGPPKLPELAKLTPPPSVASPSDELDFHERGTVMMSAVTDAQIAAATAAPPAPPKLPSKATMPAVPVVGQPRGAPWSRRAELLFEDALRLFRMGDSDGGLVSLERLLVSTELVDDLKSFVDVNQDRVLELYESVMAPWNKIPERLDPSEAPHLTPFTDQAKVAYVLSRVTGRDNARSLAIACESAGMRRLEVAAVLSQLVRARVIRLRDGI